jgi:SPP1 family predicted phage head-tail adaptor
MTKTPDGAGGETTTWTTVRDIWCQIRPLSGSKRLEALSIESATSHEIYTRWAEDITDQNRIVFSGTTYNIQAVIVPDDEHEFLHLLCNAGIAT